MNLKMKLNARILLFILSTSAIVFIAAIGTIGFNIRKKALQNSISLANTYAVEYANFSKINLDKYMITARTLSQAFSNFDVLPQLERRSTFNNILQTVLKQNDDYNAIWTIWEPNTIDTLDSYFINTPGNTYLGNYSPTFYKIGNEIKLEKNTSTTLFQGDYYTIPKSTWEETVMNPYYYSYSDNKEDSVLQTNLIVPIIFQNTFLGVVGIDVSLDKFQKITDKIKPFKKGYSLIIANNGVIISHPDSLAVNTQLANLYPKYSEKLSVCQNIQEGKRFSIKLKSYRNSNKYLYCFAPIEIGKSITPWSFVMAIPYSKIISKASTSFNMAVLIGIFGLLLLSIMIWLIARSISLPITRTTKILEKLALGDINTKNKLRTKSKDEIGYMAESVNMLIDGLNSTANFALQIGKGELDTKFNQLSNKDVLGASLLEMRESLIHAREEEEKRKLEDEKQNWITQGIAKFSELLREHNDNMEEFAFNIVFNLSKYMNVAQVAFFILNDNNSGNEVYELIATYAYKKRKYLSLDLLPGEELIGRVAVEKETIHIPNIPYDYPNLLSGIKNATRPNSLLIIPLNLNDKIYGVIELLSFNDFEPHHIDFIEKVGENIASTISMVKINMKTAALLDHSRRQADELAQHEEEMRQNMEEMLATQEGNEKKELELQGVVNALKGSSLVAEIDNEGIFTSMNETFASTFGLSRKQMLNKNIEVFFPKDTETKKVIANIFKAVANNEQFVTEQKITSYQKTIWLKMQFIPVAEENYVYKITILCQNITEGISLRETAQKLKQDIVSLS